jgi:hypothetical protein
MGGPGALTDRKLRGLDCETPSPRSLAAGCPGGHGPGRPHPVPSGFALDGAGNRNHRIRGCVRNPPPRSPISTGVRVTPQGVGGHLVIQSFADSDRSWLR